MSRVKPKKEDTFWDDRMIPTIQHPQVFEQDPTPSGLLDQDGHKLVRRKQKIGFLPEQN